MANSATDAENFLCLPTTLSKPETQMISTNTYFRNGLS
jgi:hypothetical protein